MRKLISFIGEVFVVIGLWLVSIASFQCAIEGAFDLIPYLWGFYFVVIFILIMIEMNSTLYFLWQVILSDRYDVLHGPSCGDGEILIGVRRFSFKVALSGDSSGILFLDISHTSGRRILRRYMEEHRCTSVVMYWVVAIRFMLRARSKKPSTDDFNVAKYKEDNIQ